MASPVRKSSRSCWENLPSWLILIPVSPVCGPLAGLKPGVTSFWSFMFRTVSSQTRLRPISARYMHQKEIDHHEQQKQVYALAAQ
jgi:hypothetical protein